MSLGHNPGLGLVKNGNAQVEGNVERGPHVDIIRAFQCVVTFNGLFSGAVLNILVWTHSLKRNIPGLNKQVYLKLGSACVKE